MSVGGPTLDEMLIGVGRCDLLKTGFGPFDLGFLLGSDAGENVDGGGVPSFMGLGEVGSVGFGERFFDTEVCSGDGLEIVLSRGQDFDDGEDCRCDGSGIGSVDSKFPESGAEFAGRLKVLPEVEADFMLGFPESNGGEPSPEKTGSVSFPSLE